MKTINSFLYLIIFFSNLIFAQTSTVICVPNPFTVRYNVIKDLHDQYEYKVYNPYEKETCPEYDGWVLVFNDEFNDLDLDSNKWFYIPPYRSINEAHNYFTNYPNNAKLSGGNLSMWFNTDDIFIEAIDGDIDSRKFFTGTGAFIYSKMRLPAGKLESRYRIPDNKYTSGAIWQQFENWYPYNCYQEIDGMEFYVEPTCYDIEYYNSIRMNIYKRECYKPSTQDPQDLSQRFNSCTPNLANEWYKLSYDWDNNHVDWKLNNILTRRMNKWVFAGGLGQINACKGLPNGMLVADFTKMMPSLANMNIILDVHASDKCEDKLPGSPYPATFDIDYVKYYTKINCDEVINIDNWYTSRGPGSEYPTVYTAGTINIGGDEDAYVTVNGNPYYSDPTSQYLTLIASNEINMEEGFQVTGPDGNFEAKGIDCTIEYLVPFDKYEEEFYISEAKSSIINNPEFNIDETYYNSLNNNSENIVTLYPNPANNTINLESYFNNNNNADILLYNSMGVCVAKLIQNEKINGYYKNEFDIKPLSNGLYTLHIHFNSGELFIGKFIITKTN